jgi:hypothetical protein
VEKRREKKEGRMKVIEFYERQLMGRGLKGLQKNVKHGYDADECYAKCILRKSVKRMKSELKRRVESRESVAMEPGIKHWNGIVYSHVLSQWRINALFAKRDSQGLRLAIGFHQSSILKRSFSWFKEYRDLIRTRRSRMKDAVEYHGQGLYVDAFMRWVWRIERGSEMRLVCMQVCLNSDCRRLRKRDEKW